MIKEYYQFCLIDFKSLILDTNKDLKLVFIKRGLSFEKITQDYKKLFLSDIISRIIKIENICKPGLIKILYVNYKDLQDPCIHQHFDPDKYIKFIVDIIKNIKYCFHIPLYEGNTTFKDINEDLNSLSFELKNICTKTKSKKRILDYTSDLGLKRLNFDLRAEIHNKFFV